MEPENKCKTLSNTPAHQGEGIPACVGNVKFSKEEIAEIFTPWHCGKCNSQRLSKHCPKCGNVCHKPAKGWEYPDLPPIDRIREIARSVGYAIGEHGTKQRDLDLIAAPWTDEAVFQTDFVFAIRDKLPARVVEMERKPHGRLAVTFQMDGYYKPIDLSIMPLVVKA